MSNNPVNKDPLWNRIQGNWKQLAGSIRQRWGNLTDDDIAQANGEREVLAGKIQNRHGINQDEANRQIDEWANKLKL